ncbi:MULTISPECIES: hypothetical protein [Bifidobacterium]|jgi:hypothetical protein|uniref:Uncharacterized protein n=1 Tax=Bifidobacterium tibiigranuli TaxID=2172043 RepID=A0A5N6S789_9BIFI|nr:hypothetical protein [Bifidobacterium tibiigranuli]KAE8130160.1 hypothetical protein DDE84_00820 [Bifidobacterium tibiigranuli]KAE8130482.1 hypothetical protein DDF78_00835 [Bifidobacterium tibiigranuli]MCH3974706.1 hypothetical protein [Bifidobacterium tibiigranuli]MCH4188954.1 hypothetical protein [Bifidobacterium tibiigranuli]MCH4203674.1 hypothetical protein [Bifidobacterium tibiigranuli]
MNAGIGTDWIEYRREGDHERLGWIVPEGDGFVAIDLLGERRTGPVDWMEAERCLDELGLSYLFEPYDMLTEAGEWVPVRIVNASPSSIEVKSEDYGAIDAPSTAWTLPFPKPAVLRSAATAR